MLLTTDHEGGSYELFTIPKDANGSSVVRAPFDLKHTESYTAGASYSAAVSLLSQTALPQLQILTILEVVPKRRCVWQAFLGRVSCH